MTARVCVLVVACAGLLAFPVQAQRPTMDAVAEQYVRLVLALGVHDADYVDAYYGPQAWRDQADADRMSLATIATRADLLTRQLGQITPSGGAEDLQRLRHQYLTAQLRAVRARVAMRTGRKYTFDEESRQLYDAVAPARSESDYTAVLARLESLVPGEGPMRERLERYRDAFVVPRERLDATFRAAIAGCRERTRAHIALPPDEDFSVEYVTGQPWSAYNWYQGGYRSVIQVNTDLPVRVDAVVDLACHEGYPGHHVYNVLLEKHLVRDRRWVEYTVYPLFSPQSLIAEGSANYGIEVAFPPQARLRFEQEVIFPTAGLDPDGAAAYYQVIAALDGLAHAGNDAARGYLDGTLTATAAIDWLERYTLASRTRAEQRLRFIEQYRSYVINYNLGKELVAAHVRARAGTAATEARTWREFEQLLSSPRLPSGLAR